MPVSSRKARHAADSFRPFPLLHMPAGMNRLRHPNPLSPRFAARISSRHGTTDALNSEAFHYFDTPNCQATATLRRRRHPFGLPLPRSLRASAPRCEPVFASSFASVAPWQFNHPWASPTGPRRRLPCAATGALARWRRPARPSRHRLHDGDYATDAPTPDAVEASSAASARPSPPSANASAPSCPRQRASGAEITTFAATPTAAAPAGPMSRLALPSREDLARRDFINASPRTPSATASSTCTRPPRTSPPTSSARRRRPCYALPQKIPPHPPRHPVSPASWTLRSERHARRHGPDAADLIPTRFLPGGARHAETRQAPRGELTRPARSRSPCIETLVGLPGAPMVGLRTEPLPPVRCLGPQRRDRRRWWPSPRRPSACAALEPPSCTTLASPPSAT